ncbi:MAG: Phospho-N-acetylmuramoyl-pentapeptide-transferase [Verrucomicrobiaceae bacterium]|nr:Phospho-N-acetylmuramoyl-pentapeptide-transferase [Verrucomicrobiaceae bacterium]
MIYWLYEHREWFAWEWAGGHEGLLYKLLNLFKYHTFRAGGAALTAFALSLIFGEWVIRKLISLKVGQPIRTAAEVGKLFELQGKKIGTPTMGGVLIIGSLLASTLIWARWDNLMMWTTMFATVGLGGLGFMDDYEKVAKKNSKGVSARYKLVWQGAVGLIVGLLFAYGMEVQGIGFSNMRELHLPFIKGPVIADMGIFAVLFYMVMIQGTSNAVNLTDGLDGLATGCSLTTALAYTAFTYVAGNDKFADYLHVPHHPRAAELTTVAMALAGSCLGFLWWNAHPARMFMGDTGSLALGGCIASLAIGSRQEIVLVVVGGVFVMEALSVIIQVVSFKKRGKRVFRMAPIHHHFELGGWVENQVIIRFWVLSLICALVGLGTLKLL